MSGSVGLIVVLLVLAGALAWMVLGPRRSPGGSDGSEDGDALAAAEDEVRDLDALASPDDAAEDLPDWGPGAPKP